MVNTPVTITAVYVSGSISPDPKDPAWAQAQEVAIDLTRKLNEVGARVSLDESRNIRIKALHNGNDIFLLCQWSEDKPNASVDDYPKFADAFAIQIPLFTDSSILCMGSMDMPVNIIFWRADLSKPENIVAGGMGTPQTSPDAESQNIRHYQDWSGGEWSVIIARQMTSASENQVSLRRGSSYKIAFASWRGGAYGERGGHKIISEWHNLDIK